MSAFVRHTITVESDGERYGVRVTEHATGQTRLHNGRSYADVLLWAHGVIMEDVQERPEGKEDDR